MIKYFIFFLFLFHGISNAEPKRSVPIELGGINFALEEYSGEVVNHEIYGEYIASSNSLNEFHYHFFPDGKFLVTTNCDLCTEVPIAEGSFKFSNGRVLLKYKTAKGSALPSSPFFVFHGTARPGVNLESKYEIILLDEQNYLRAVASETEFEFFRRRELYVNWQGIYSRLKHRVKTHGSIVTPNGYPKLTPPR